MVVPTPGRGWSKCGKASADRPARQPSSCPRADSVGFTVCLPSLGEVYTSKEATAVGCSSAERTGTVEGTAAPCHAFHLRSAAPIREWRSPLICLKSWGGDEPWGRHGVSGQESGESALATRIRGYSDTE